MKSKSTRRQEALARAAAKYCAAEARAKYPRSGQEASRAARFFLERYPSVDSYLDLFR